MHASSLLNKSTFILACRNILLSPSSTFVLRAPDLVCTAWTVGSPILKVHTYSIYILKYTHRHASNFFNLLLSFFAYGLFGRVSPKTTLLVKPKKKASPRFWFILARISKWLHANKLPRFA